MSVRISPVLRNLAARRLPKANAPVIRRRLATQGAAAGTPPPPPPPPPPPKSGGGGSGVLIGVAALAAAAGGAYWYFNVERPKEYLEAVKEHTQADYQKVYDAIAAGLDKEDYDDGSLAPVVLRLAWHASGTYDKNDKTGGSNYATMRFQNESNHGANAGLNVARDYMEGVKKQFPWISYGDLWTLGGVAAVQETGGPVVPWRPGRVDGLEINQTPDGRLPDASQAQDHLRDIFYRMGFNDQEIVALAGAHALGRCHTDRSGYDGPWTFSPVTFSNQYYDLLLNDKWSWRKWKGPAQYEDKSKTLMMLPADMALAKDKAFRKYVEIYAKDEDKFFQDFSKAAATLFELGVPKEQFKGEPWTMKST